MNGAGPVGGGGAGLRDIMALRQQILDRSQLLQQLHAPPAAQEVQSASPAGGFTDALRSALVTVSASQAKAENLSSAWQRGEMTDVAQVMLARQEAGVAFEATLQVRNRLLSAYQDIMRMGV